MACMNERQESRDFAAACSAVKFIASIAGKSYDARGRDPTRKFHVEFAPRLWIFRTLFRRHA
jgi:hypothetical protein